MTTLSDVKAAMRITHSDDDALLNRLIGSATREALRFMNSASLPAVPGDPASVDFPEDVFQAVVLLVQADYEGNPETRTNYRIAAEQLMYPYRIDLGV